MYSFDSHRIQQMTTTTTVVSLKSKYFCIIILSTIICLILLISIFIFITIQYQSKTSQITSKLISKQTTTTTLSTTTLSPEELRRLSAFKQFLNLPIDHPNPNPTGSSNIMNQFMRSVYHQISDTSNVRRRKRQTDFSLSDQADFIISLPNNSPTKNAYHFEYDSSLEHLIYAELILPINHRSTIHISSLMFNISINQTIVKDENWLKINLTEYVQSFPLKFYSNNQTNLFGFLTLYFRRSTHSMVRRDLSSFYDNQLVTYPDDPSYCQVRPLRTSFSELKWSSWILEPRSYEMNICSGTCHTQSNMGIHFLIQNLLNQKYPKKIPTPCCKPKRFSSTILLYYDGPNLVLKRHENMRVIECGCSS